MITLSRGARYMEIQSAAGFKQVEQNAVWEEAGRYEEEGSEQG
jgi:hypothetical protein